MASKYRNAGRKPKYGIHKTKAQSVAVPTPKLKEFKELIKELKSKWVEELN